MSILLRLLRGLPEASEVLHLMCDVACCPHSISLLPRQLLLCNARVEQLAIRLDNTHMDDTSLCQNIIWDIMGQSERFQGSMSKCV